MSGYPPGRAYVHREQALEALRRRLDEPDAWTPEQIEALALRLLATHPASPGLWAFVMERPLDELDENALISWAQMQRAFGPNSHKHRWYVEAFDDTEQVKAYRIRLRGDQTPTDLIATSSASELGLEAVLAATGWSVVEACTPLEWPWLAQIERVSR